MSPVQDQHLKAPLTIATAQSTIDVDVRKNGAEVRMLMRQALEEGAQLVHFPEGALSGYVKSQIMDWKDVDWQQLREELEHICQLAGELGIWVVLGCNHPLTAPHRPHNSLYVISSAGELHTRYDKQWLSHTELSDWYTPGHELTIFEVQGWRFGCAICIEIQFPELFLAYAQAGVDGLLYAAYSDSVMFGIQAQAYAAVHTIWFGFSTPSQMSHTLASHMIGPDGEIQMRCQTGVSGLCLSQLDMNEPRWHVALNLAKPWRARARAGGIYQERLVDDVRSKDKTRL